MASKKQKVSLDEKEVAAVRRTLGLLEKRYEHFIDQPEKDFFLGLADYLKSISDSTLLDGLAGMLIQGEREKDLADFWSLEKAFLGEVKKVEPKILKIGKSVEQSDAIKESLREVDGIKTRQIISSSPFPLALHDALADVLRTVKDAGHRELVKKYVEFLPDSDLVARFNLCESHDDYVRSLGLVKKLDKVSVWGSWDELQKIRHSAYPKIVSIGEMHNATRTQQFVSNFYAGAFEATINGRDRSVYFKYSDFKTHIARVHHFLTEQIEQTLHDFSPGVKLQKVESVTGNEIATSVDFDKSQSRFILNGNSPFLLKNADIMLSAIALFWEFRSDKRRGVETNKTKERDLSLYELGSNLGVDVNKARQAIKRIRAFLKRYHQLPIRLEHVSKGKYKIFVSIL